MAKKKENSALSAYAIGNENYEVIISQSKEIAWYWFRDNAGYTNEQMKNFSIWVFDMERKVYIKNYREVSAEEIIKEVQELDSFSGFPIVAFEKKSHQEYFTNWYTSWNEKNSNS
ncbi:hypothetical protein O0Q50_21820 [Priestia aryabhattai]|uniref:Uncharacterized protein n=1 Tax=Priestia aryabhattai TaxID=412384 RepID=A0AAX6NDT3_PRIAR|nr:hypothetical protein [Priestia aryabhattai]MDU9693820.1 hypothetical protein [Priestia aryabhattai]